MQLRVIDIAGVADAAEQLPTLYPVAARDIDCPQMAIGSHPTATMVDQHQPAINPDFIARIGNHAVTGRRNRRAFTSADVNAVIHPPAALTAIARYERAIDRPAKSPGKIGRYLEEVLANSLARADHR